MASDPVFLEPIAHYGGGFGPEYGFDSIQFKVVPEPSAWSLIALSGSALFVIAAVNRKSVRQRCCSKV